MAERSAFVIGTAGHVDHGKTSLVFALTGVDCDRLPEEKARGITLELGFARWALERGLVASFVDVPGHERFVRTMIGGAAAVDLVLLTVAADDGVMPQTVEHLAICDLLGARGGVVAITKADAVTPERLVEVTRDVHALARGTFLEGAAAVACSARTRLGLDALTVAVIRALREQAGRARPGPAYLAVDRAFTRPGAGEVLTGTLLRGALRVGDAVDAVSIIGGAVAALTVKSLHVHGAAVNEAHAASRVALSLRGEAPADLARGTVIAERGSIAPTCVILAEVRLLGGTAPLRKRARALLHVGTVQVAAEIALVERTELAPGETGLVRIATRRPIAVFAGQRMIVRRPDLDAHRTLGGGVIVDPHPPLRRARTALFFRERDDVSRVRALVREARGRGAAERELALRLPVEVDLAACLRTLAGGGEIVSIAPAPRAAYVARALVDEGMEQIISALAAFHAARPMLDGASPGELTTQLPPRLRSVGPAALDALAAEGRVVREAGVVRLGARTGASPRPLRDDVAARYAAAGLAPPLDEEMRATLNLDVHAFRDVLAELKKLGTLRMLTAAMHFDVGAMLRLKAALRRYFEAYAELSPGDFKALAGLTRKHAIPILEWLDSEGLTRRKGDRRVPGPTLLRAP